VDPSTPSEVTERPATRESIVASLRDRLLRDSFPRLTVLLIVGAAGGCAFLFSAIALAMGLDSMAVRYGLAALAGYASFALFVRGWISLRKGNFDLAADLPIPDLDFSSPGSSAAMAPRLFMGGQSGGGGGTGAWTDASGNVRSVAPMPVAAPAQSSGGTGAGRVFGALDADDAWKVIAAAALVMGAVVAAGFVVYSSPALLAEVAIDAGVMTSVYRRMRRQDLGHWTGAVLRRRWVPALVIVVFMSGAGFLLQSAAPDARSIGGVVRALGER